MTSAPRFLDAGECALVVEFGTAIDVATTERVHTLDAVLRSAALPGVAETVPTYRSLMVHYDPFVVSRDALKDAVLGLLDSPARGPTRSATWRLPACCDTAVAEDIPHVAQATGLAPEAVADTFLRATYTVAMYGFAPGWAYLSGLPTSLSLPRRATPRAEIPGGSLIIAGGQAIVAGSAMPSGWHILGRTPVRMFDPGRDPAFFVASGDFITFVPVEKDAFHELERRAARGDLVAERVA